MKKILIMILVVFVMYSFVGCNKGVRPKAPTGLHIVEEKSAECSERVKVLLEVAASYSDEAIPL